MGNAISPATGDMLKTAAISKYMKLTKPQVLTIRDHLQAKQSVGRNHHRGTIRRELWTQALQAALVRDDPDRDILELLFTMWDSNGTGRVACSELVVGISVLACRYDGVRDALRFALEVYSDQHDTQMISSRDASALLRSKCSPFLSCALSLSLRLLGLQLLGFFGLCWLLLFRCAFTLCTW